MKTTAGQPSPFCGAIRIGEGLERRWENGGHVVVSDKPPKKIDLDQDGYYRYQPGRRDGVYAAAGEEVPGRALPDADRQPRWG